MNPVCPYCGYRTCRCPKDEPVKTAEEVMVTYCNCGAWRRWGIGKFCGGHDESCPWYSGKQR